MFHVGQKVVCVNDDENGFLTSGVTYRDGLDGLKVGEMYTIREIVNRDGEYPGWAIYSVRLTEIKRSSVNPHGVEAPFAAAPFRPLHERGMSILHAIAANPHKELEPA